MGRRLNGLAAQIRILKRSSPSPSLLTVSLALHEHHCALLGHNVRFATQALELARPVTSRTSYQHARRIHRTAALERHNVWQVDPDVVPEDLLPHPAASTSSPLAWPPLPAQAIECGVLESKLSTRHCWNIDATPFIPFSGASHHLKPESDRVVGYDPLIYWLLGCQPH